MSLPRHLLDRVERVLDFHHSTKHIHGSLSRTVETDVSNPPDPNLVFVEHPRVSLPRKLLDVNVPTISLLEHHRDSVPDSHLNPPHDLTTLATWLFMSNGQTKRVADGARKIWLRTCTSSAALFPYEMYVAAFGVEGLEPGLYHYSPKEFSLRKLREGQEALFTIKRGRPDLEFLKRSAAAMFVSAVFCRPAWKFGKRGYRYALLDSGHLIENIVQSATALGIQTVTRLSLNDANMAELIGVPQDALFSQAESVQAMVVWADEAKTPLPPRSPTAPAEPLQFIERPISCPSKLTYGSILAAHEDCVAPGTALREIRPPTTELDPVPPELKRVTMSMLEQPHGGEMLSAVLSTRRSASDFQWKGISRDHFLWLSKLAFRGGTYFPFHPDGNYVAAIRPFWIISDVTGMENGIWYYHPPWDTWTILTRGTFRLQSAHLALQNKNVAHAPAVCFMAANLHGLMTQAGPDLYRLAHLEAGIVGQRLTLAANAMGLSCCGLGGFYDDEARQFLGLGQSNWQILYMMAVGYAVEEQHPSSST
jgi:SagB-type dehydrogenase family enzyme